MKRTSARLLSIGLLSLAAASVSLFADEFAPAKAPDQPAKPPKLLVMQNGRVIDGRINPCSGGYMVEKENGNMIVPDDLVQFEADSLSDAHEKLQRQIIKQTPQTRLNLARWCLSNRLHDEAMDELRAALELEPDNAEALQMLEGVELLKERNDNALTPTSPKLEQTPDGFRPQQAESLAGLSPESIREFATHVQPILLNRCGNVNCHGSAKGGSFRLTHLRGGQGSRRRAIEDNLSVSLKQLDTANARLSPLLTVPQKGHGRNNSEIFLGARDESLRETLEKWAVQVVAEKTKPQAKPNSRQTTRSVFVEIPQAPFRKSNSPITRPAYKHFESQDANGKKDASPVAARSDAENAHDAFDPQAFNRKKFGNSRRKVPSPAGN